MQELSVDGSSSSAHLLCASHVKKLVQPFAHIMMSTHASTIIEADLISELTALQSLIMSKCLSMAFSVSDPDEMTPFERGVHALRVQHAARLRCCKDQQSGSISVIENYIRYLESFTVERELTLLADASITS